MSPAHGSSGAPLCPVCGQPLDDASAPCPLCAETKVEPAPVKPKEPIPAIRIPGYRIVRKLGSGGMGTVYEAHDEKMNRPVALKVLARHATTSDKQEKRFEREAWIAGRLEHPNLVKVYDRGESGGLRYFSMELVDGGSLHDVIVNMRKFGRDEAIGLEFGSREYVHWAIAQVIHVARALDYAHRQGVIHRDVKPMNLLLGKDRGTIKVADFGIAIQSEATRMTTEGNVLGTLAYMAPEQILGRRDDIGIATDVYGLGVNLFELLTLSLPYQAATQELYLSAVLTAEARRPRKLNQRVGRDLEVVIRKTLEKDPRDRFPSAGALADDLENVLHLRPILARPPGRGRRIWKWVRRKPLHAALLGLLAVGVPAVSILTTLAIRNAAMQRQTRVDALMDRARELVDLQQDRDAVVPLREILSLQPDNTDALRMAALLDHRQILEAGSDTLAAAEAGRRALERIDRLIGLWPDSASPHALKASVLRRLGRTDEAGVEAELARRNRSARPTTDELSLDGALAREDGLHEEALDKFSRIVRRDPSNYGAVINRADMLEALGRLEQATEDYRFAVRLRPRDPVPRLRLAHTLGRRGMLEDAEGELQMAQRLASDRPEILESVSYHSHLLGQRFLSRGDREAAGRHVELAEEAARRVVELDPDRPLGHINLGISLVERSRLQGGADRGVLEQALGHYDRALTLAKQGGPGLDEVVGKALRNRCDVGIELRDLQPALEACSEALDFEPDNPINHYNMAGVLALSGRVDEAFRSLERDVELGDEDWAYLLRDRWFEPLREDPRFEKLIERMKPSAAGR